MFSELAVAAGVIGVAFFIYKWFELIILKKERMNIIQRLEGESLMEYAKRIPIGLGRGNTVGADAVCADKIHPVQPQAKALRWGMLMLGIGLGAFMGVLFAYDIDISSFENIYSPRYMCELIVGAWIILGGGLGLVLAFIIERIMYKKEE